MLGSNFPYNKHRQGEVGNESNAKKGPRGTAPVPDCSKVSPHGESAAKKGTGAETDTKHLTEGSVKKLSL